MSLGRSQVFQRDAQRSRCVDAHEKVLKLKPDYYDAYLSIGVYDYIAGGLPFGYKPMASMGSSRQQETRIGRLQTIIENNPDGRRRPHIAGGHFPEREAV